MRIPFLNNPARWADPLLSLVYPEVCQLCGSERALRAHAYVGEACRAAVKVIEPPYCQRCGRPEEGAITNEYICGNCGELELHFCWARSAVVADGPVLDAIHKFKYNGQRWLEPFLGDLLVSAAAASLRADNWDGLVPVPLWPTKEREREFNQAERLARYLSHATGIPLERKLIKRVLPTPSQTRLTREARQDNMRGAFALRRRQSLEGRSYVLIDDVFTTGATTSACAKVLLKAGAAQVAVWTVARGV